MWRRRRRRKIKDEVTPFVIFSISFSELSRLGRGWVKQRGTEAKNKKGTLVSKALQDSASSAAFSETFPPHFGELEICKHHNSPYHTSFFLPHFPFFHFYFYFFIFFPSHNIVQGKYTQNAQSFLSKKKKKSH